MLLKFSAVVCSWITYHLWTGLYTIKIQETTVPAVTTVTQKRVCYSARSEWTDAGRRAIARLLQSVRLHRAPKRLRFCVGCILHVDCYIVSSELTVQDYAYVELPKNSGNLTIKKFLTVTRSFHRLLRSSPLGHVYSNPSVFPMISCIPGSSQMWVCRWPLAFLRGSPQSGQNDALSAVISSWGIRKKSQGRG